MNYSELSSEKKEKFNNYLIKAASDQSANGREVFEYLNKAILLANTGGIAITVPLLTSSEVQIHALVIKVALARIFHEG